MQDNNQQPYHMHEEDDSMDSKFFVASSTDCTGLIPAAPITENEVDSYNELYDIPLAKNAKDANHSVQDIRKTKASLFNKTNNSNLK